ncbi:putative NACHT domain-containing protein 3 [Homarus americanus]|uniref:Putative NACHT domain-containing protein 3 n=1 Tax=Homarus americanus TaxID=6706 RepID=A0A8J5IZ71_HOMAM|nr:putative NACHT domain-containing protein 3 [Homarus americanus]
MENGNLLKFQIFRLLNGPVHQAFVYLFHQTYTQDTDVYSCAVKCGLTEFFTETELSALRHEKRPTRHSLPLLFTILKTCCHPSLAPPDSPIWNDARHIPTDQLSNEAPVENLLVTFLKTYEEFCTNAPLSQERFDEKISEITRWLEWLIEGAGRHDITGRWREDLQRIMAGFQDVLSGERRKSSSAEITDPGQNIGVATLVTGLAADDESSHGTVCLVRGEAGCGRSCLATLLASSWTQKDERVSLIGSYQATIVVSGTAFVSNEEDFVCVILPLCSTTHGADKVRTWLREVHVLLVIDDAEELSTERTQEVKDLVTGSQSLSAVMLALPSCYDSLRRDWADLAPVRLHLNGYNREEIVTLAEEYVGRRASTADPKCLKKYLTKNLCRLSQVLKYPDSLVQACECYMERPDAYDDITTSTDMLWTLTLWRINKAVGSPEGTIGTKALQWLMMAGRKSLEAFRKNKRLEGDIMLELETETSNMFPESVGRTLVSSVFKQRHYYGACGRGFSSVHAVQQEFLAAWYAVHKIVEFKKWRQLVGDSQCAYRLALFIGGLLSKMKRWSRNLSELDERRAIGSVLNHGEESSENLTFNLDLVAEVKGAPQVVEYIVEMSEYPDEWNVSAADVQLIPLEALLMNVAPTRIFLNVEELKPYSELSKVIGFLCRVDIFVWLDSSSQYRYGNDGKMDRIVKAFFTEHVMAKVDLLAGCVSLKVMREFPSKAAFSHLVYIKMRVLDKKCLSTLLDINKYLQKLLWLEAKIDFPILDEEINDLPCSTVPLMDVHLQGIEDSSVAKLVNLLGTLHTSYTGIHLENTTFTPEGLFVLLKQLQKRDIRLYSEPESRERFRRWYYPQLSACDPSVKLTDEMAKEMLGYDDRIYYSNHVVTSSCFALALDAWNLMSYLEEQQDIVHFTYKTENLSFLKKLDGSVTIEAHNENLNYKMT